ncbi:hypothetical protein M513_12002 [Trichuris suis]|uniref:Uncharacterized protein n=1 Tax=Trichuris suis TaxID=68888 RepID=A0A085LQ46_9BILA|nr:hypothetical protein M513_12002 [Trichuris suis]
MIERMSYGFSFAYPCSLTDVGGCSWNHEFSDGIIAANCLPERFSGIACRQFVFFSLVPCVCFIRPFDISATSLFDKHVFVCSIQFDSVDFVLVVKMWKVLLKEFQVSTQGWEQMLDETPGEDMIKVVRSKLYMSILLLTNLANLFEDKELCKARSEADNDGKTARGGSRRGGERTANVQLSINWIHEKKLLATECARCLAQPTADPAVFLNLVQSVYRVDAGRSFVTALFISSANGRSGTEMNNGNTGGSNKKKNQEESNLYGAGTMHGVFADAANACSVAMRAGAMLSPTLRIGIVNVYCELVSVKLHGKNLEPRDRNLRNQLAAVMLLSIESVSRQTDNVKADLERLRLLSEWMDCTFVVHPVLAVVSVLPADGISKREETEFWNRPRNAAEEAAESVYNTFWK